jgi:hypothetical protein
MIFPPLARAAGELYAKWARQIGWKNKDSSPDTFLIIQGNDARLELVLRTIPPLIVRIRLTSGFLRKYLEAGPEKKITLECALAADAQQSLSQMVAKERAKKGITHEEKKRAPTLDVNPGVQKSGQEI